MRWIAGPLFVFAAALAAAPLVPANVVRPAPDFHWGTGKGATMRALRGQPVIVIIAPSPRDGRFRSQMNRIWDRYREISGKETIVLAAFTQEPAPVKSNVPAVVVPDGASVASAFGADPSRFTIAIIGKDGNVDLLSDDVQAGQRIFDVIVNSFAIQSKRREE